MFSFLIFLPLLNLEGNEDIVSPTRSESKVTLPVYAQGFPSIFNPFPERSTSLIQPLDSLKLPKGIIDFSFGQRKIDVVVSWDWSTITLTETIDNRNLKIPITSSLDWYLRTLQKKSWQVAFLEVMQTAKKDDKRRGRGQMLEVVGVDIGRLGRASLNVSGNVNINGKMVFQDQELVRSTLNETQNTHLEFDQKQNLNIKGKVGDRITVAMDQDSERQFDWENNIRISYEGYEDDIIQKVEAGNISLSLP